MCVSVHLFRAVIGYGFAHFSRNDNGYPSGASFIRQGGGIPASAPAGWRKRVGGKRPCNRWASQSALLRRSQVGCLRGKPGSGAGGGTKREAAKRRRESEALRAARAGPLRRSREARPPESPEPRLTRRGSKWLFSGLTGEERWRRRRGKAGG